MSNTIFIFQNLSYNLFFIKEIFMQEQKRFLLDEARAEEPVKNTLRLAWEFIVLNKNFTLTAMSLLLLLNILTIFLGLLTMVISGILSLAIQIYFSKLVYYAQDIEMFVDEIKASKVEVAVSKNAFVATGAYFAWIILFFALLFTLVIVVQSYGFSLENVKMVEELIPIAQTLFLPISILALLLSYINPLVHSNIALAQDFKGGFLATFSIFSPALWQNSFKNGYPKYIAMIMGLIFLATLLLGIFINLPVINILANFIIIVMMYGYMVLISVVSMMGRRMVESQF